MTKTFLKLAIIATFITALGAQASDQGSEEGVAESEAAIEQGGEGFSDALRYALTCIYSNVGKINYQIKWGKDGTYQNMSVAGGTAWRSHYHQYANSSSHVSPDLYIRFDSDMTGGKYFQEYKLARYASEDTDCNTKGKKYRFVKDNSDRFIELKSFN